MTKGPLKKEGFSIPKITTSTMMIDSKRNLGEATKLATLEREVWLTVPSGLQLHPCSSQYLSLEFEVRLQNLA